MADYSPDAVFFSPAGPLKGPEAIKPFFQTLVSEFAKPGSSFTMLQRSIDGDHAYAGVKGDFDCYADLVRPGGLIAFHDIRPNLQIPAIQVFRLWDELKQNSNYTSEEIIHEPYQGQFGIGLLTKNG